MGVGGRAGRGIVESQDDHLTQEGEEKTRMLSDFVCEFHNRTRDHAPGQGKIERHVLQSIVRRTEACRVTGGPNPTLDWFRPLFYACHDTIAIDTVSCHIKPMTRWKLLGKDTNDCTMFINMRYKLQLPLLPWRTDAYVNTE